MFIGLETLFDYFISIIATSWDACICQLTSVEVLCVDRAGYQHWSTELPRCPQGQVVPSGAGRALRGRSRPACLHFAQLGLFCCWLLGHQQPGDLFLLKHWWHYFFLCHLVKAGKTLQKYDRLSYFFYLTFFDFAHYNNFYVIKKTQTEWA